MTYSVNPNMDIDTDEAIIDSVRRIVFEEYPSSTILLERNPGSFVRPSFKIEVGEIQSRDFSSAFFVTGRSVRIRYNGNSRSDTYQVISNLRNVFSVRKRQIPHLLRDWRYPKPALRAVEGGTLSAGTYYMAVAAQNLMGEYSLVSQESAITISADEDIKVMIPMVGAGIGYFKGFKIYAGTVAGNISLLATVEASEDALVTQYTVTAMPSAVSLPATSSEMFYRFLKPSNFNNVYMEDLVDPSKWDGILTFDVSFISARMPTQKVPITTITQAYS